MGKLTFTFSLWTVIIGQIFVCSFGFIAGYVYVEVQVERGIYIGQIASAAWQLTFLKLLRTGDYSGAEKAHEFLLQTNLKTIKDGVWNIRLIRETPEAEELQRNLQTYNRESPQAKIPDALIHFADY